MRNGRKKIAYLILNNIRSAHNVGSMFRTADAAAIAKVYLVGYTPAPIDQFGRTDMTIAKTALGGEHSVSWEKVRTLGPLLKRLKKDGVQLIALEQDERSVDYKKVRPQYPVAIIAGNEVLGISKQTLKHCDIVAEIPMNGKKESLNVAVSVGVALFRMLDV